MLRDFVIAGATFVLAIIFVIPTHIYAVIANWDNGLSFKFFLPHLIALLPSIFLAKYVGKSWRASLILLGLFSIILVPLLLVTLGFKF